MNRWVRHVFLSLPGWLRRWIPQKRLVPDEEEPFVVAGVTIGRCFGSSRRWVWRPFEQCNSPRCGRCATESTAMGLRLCKRHFRELYNG